MTLADRISTLALAAVVSALVAAFSTPAASAPARSASAAPVTQSQLKALKTRLSKDEKELGSVAVVLAHCFLVQAVPVSQYDGYTVTYADGTTGTASALDVTAEGDTPGAYLVGTPQDCADQFTPGSARALAKAGGPARIAALLGRFR
jgi:hypothetical protein